MNILILTERFFPSVGGVQTVTRLVGEALGQTGQWVTILTNEAGADASAPGPRLVRQPGALRLLKEFRKARAVLLQGLTIRLGWPLLFLRRHALMVHHNAPLPPDGRPSSRVRTALARRVKHAAVSRALARELPFAPGPILANPYEEQIFHNDQPVPHVRDVLFVGRLIPEKGVSVLIRALSILHQKNLALSATIIGDGPEKAKLEEMVRLRGLDQRVHFVGQVQGAVLAAAFKAHRMLVIPSIYEEPFGVVALEGIACGCAVIGSNTGGLPEAIGACGLTFPAGDPSALAVSIQDVLGSEEMRRRFRACAAGHLAPHRPATVALRYLAALDAAGIDGVNTTSLSSVVR